ncbi:MAG TPA: alpha/beta hydrolase [Ktedonobacteraceae bacterium]|nr:alpha/beta hydrolase [Ktedonobacteraceae bacterium]
MSTKFLTVSGGTIAYDDQGTGPLVLCIPSMGDVRQEYRFLVPQLVGAGYRVVTMDVRGHGESSANWPDYSVAAVGADALALIRHLQAGPALIVGASMAAGASVWAAAEEPDLVAGMVLIGPFVHDIGPLWPGRILFSVLFAWPWGRAVWMRYFSTLYPTRHPSDWQAYLQGLRRNLGEPGRMSALRHMIRASKKASGDRVDKVQVPALVIMGTRDPDFKQPSQEAQWVGNALHAPVHMIEGAGHYPHAEMPEQIVPLLLSFFKKEEESLSYGA